MSWPRPVIHEEAGLVKVTDHAGLGAVPLAAARAVAETLQSSCQGRSNSDPFAPVESGPPLL
jgi:hypothetical protein